MNKQELLRSLGFTEYEVSALVSLIKLRVATPRDISLDSGVPQNKLYVILDSFKNRGLLSVVPSQTKKYRLINLKSFIDSKIVEKEKSLLDLKKSAKDVDVLPEADEDFVFCLIKGQKNIMNQLAEHNSSVEKEILSVQRNWKVWNPGISAMHDSVKRGVDVRMIGVISKETGKRASEWKRIGCKIRSYDSSFGDYPLRFSIFDNKEARITIGKPEISNPDDYITIWTKSSPLINILRKQFFLMWDKGKSF